MQNVLVRFNPARHIEDFHHRGTEFSESYNFYGDHSPFGLVENKREHGAI